MLGTVATRQNFFYCHHRRQTRKLIQEVVLLLCLNLLIHLYNVYCKVIGACVIAVVIYITVVVDHISSIFYIGNSFV